MSAGNQQPASTWTEPPWSGWIETTGDALLILEAARRGLIPRVTRRLVDSERKMITSGSVFVFDEDESGIKRWTDGFFWSPSRILGNFLLYRETDKRGSGHRGGRAQDGSDGDANDVPQSPEARQETQSLSRPKIDGSHLGLDKLRERSLMGSLTNSYKFKSDGLMKKTFSLNIGGVAQHLISYYRIEDVENGRLRSPSSLPELASLDISPEYLDKTHFRNPPKVEVGPDGIPRYRGEADDVETSPSIITAPSALASGLPLLTDGRLTEGGKRARRFDPLASSAKRQRKGKTTPEASTSASALSAPSSADQLPPQHALTHPHPIPPAIMQPAQVYTDPNPPPPGSQRPTQAYPYTGYYPSYPLPPPPHIYSSPYPAPVPPNTSSPAPTTASTPQPHPHPHTHTHPHPLPHPHSNSPTTIVTPPIPPGAIPIPTPQGIPYPYPSYPHSNTGPNSNTSTSSNSNTPQSSATVSTPSSTDSSSNSTSRSTPTPTSSTSHASPPPPSTTTATPTPTTAAAYYGYYHPPHPHGAYAYPPWGAAPPYGPAPGVGVGVGVGVGYPGVHGVQGVPGVQGVQPGHSVGSVGAGVGSVDKGGQDDGGEEDED